MESVKVALVSDTAKVMQRASGEAAGYDIYADLRGEGGEIVIEPRKLVLISTGLKTDIPYGYEAVIRSRSGLSTKKKLILINGVGTVDSDYRGEWMIPLYNLSDEPVTIKHNERIAQVIFQKVNYPEIEVVSENDLSISERDCGGFGHTGKF